MANNRQNTGWRHRDDSTRKEFERMSPVASSEVKTTKASTPTQTTQTPKGTNNSATNNAQDLTIALRHNDVLKRLTKRMNFLDTDSVTWSISRIGTNQVNILATINEVPVLEVLTGELTCDIVPQDYTDIPSSSDWTQANAFHQNYYYGAIVHNWNLTDNDHYTLDLIWKDADGVLTNTSFQMPMRHYGIDANAIIVESPNELPQIYYYTLVRYLTGAENAAGTAVLADYDNVYPIGQRAVLGYRIAGEDAVANDEFITKKQLSANSLVKQAVVTVLFYTGSGATYTQVNFSGAAYSGIGATITCDTPGYIADNTVFTDDIGGSLLNSIGRRVFVVGGSGYGTWTGIYTVTNRGDASTPFELTRATDFDEPVEVPRGTMFFVYEGLYDIDGGYRDKLIVITSSISQFGSSSPVYQIVNPKLYLDDIYEEGTSNSLLNILDEKVFGTDGTANKVAKYIDPETIGDSSISDDGTLVTVGGALTATGAGNFTAVGLFTHLLSTLGAAGQSLSISAQGDLNLSPSSNYILQMQGVSRPVRTVTATTTLDKTDHHIIFNHGAGTVTANLPAASSGKLEFIITTRQGFQVDVDANGTDTLQGNGVVGITGAYTKMLLWSNGVSEWYYIIS